jgi:hypothetical protein
LYRKEETLQIAPNQTIPTMKIPDHHTSKLGSKDFVFQVNKWPFSITCNPLLPTITESFIDLALVKDMKIAMKKVECRNISYGGLTTKLVGTISQTVQVVYNGVPSGTMHLKAKVIRNLTNLYGVDCIAGQKLYKGLTMAASTLDSSFTSVVSSAATSRSIDESNDHTASDTTDDDAEAEELVYDAEDSPRTRKRKRRNRFQVANLSFTGSMFSSPPASPRSSTPTSEPTQVQVSKTNLTSPYPGNTVPCQTRREPPPHLQNPPLMLADLILCGHAPPCSCVETLRAQQLQLLPPHYPVYLPVGHQPCGHHCASHHVHGDNLHPPNPSLCACEPPRLLPGYVRGHNVPPQDVSFAPPDEASPKTETMSDTTTYVQSIASSKYTCIDCGEQFSTCQGNCPESRVFQHISSVGDPHHDGGHADAPPLPPDFQPCGNYCGYQICQCLRNYEGRDWAS